MAVRDLVFRRTFHRSREAPSAAASLRSARKGGKNAAGGRSKRFFLLTYVLAQSKYHKRTKLGGKNYASTPQRALSERHGSFLHNGRAAIRVYDRSVSARGQRRGARKRSSPRSQRSQTRRRSHQFAFCASADGGSGDWSENGPGASQERHGCHTGENGDRVSSCATATIRKNTGTVASSRKRAEQTL